jgi:radical SAM superfamily enzyme YgiQ (UPF0313 family)
MEYFKKNKKLEFLSGVSLIRKKYIRNPSNFIPKPIDSYPYPADPVLKKYQRSGLGFIDICPGCPYNCDFCINARSTNCIKYTPSIRPSVRYVVNYIKYLVNKYGFQTIAILDECITIDKQYFRRLCEETKHVDINLSCLTRIDLIDTDIISKMVEGRFRSVYFGIESFSPRTLSLFNKTPNPTNYIKNSTKIILKLANSQIVPTVSTIIGYPGETWNDMLITVNNLKELALRGVVPQLHLPQPMPGTTFFERNKNNLVYVAEKYVSYGGPKDCFKEKYKEFSWMVPELYLAKNPLIDSESLIDFYLKSGSELMRVSGNAKP